MAETLSLGFYKDDEEKVNVLVVTGKNLGVSFRPTSILDIQVKGTMMRPSFTDKVVPVLLDMITVLGVKVTTRFTLSKRISEEPGKGLETSVTEQGSEVLLLNLLTG